MNVYLIRKMGHKGTKIPLYTIEIDINPVRRVLYVSRYTLDLLPIFI